MLKSVTVQVRSSLPIKLMKLNLFFLLFIASLTNASHLDNCEEEFVEGIGWKKIIYTENGPIEMLGRCKSDEENAATLLLMGLIIWGIYEYYDEDEYPQALFYSNNLQIMPFNEIRFNSGLDASINVTLFKYSF